MRPHKVLGSRGGGGAGDVTPFPTIASPCNTAAGNPKRHTRRRASQQCKNRSTQTRPQAAGDGKKHPMRTGAPETKQHTASNCPECNRIRSIRLHPDTRERSSKSTAPSSGFGPSQIPFSLFVPSQHTKTAVSELHYVRQGFASAPQFHLVRALHGSLLCLLWLRCCCDCDCDWIPRWHRVRRVLQRGAMVRNA